MTSSRRALWRISVACGLAWTVAQARGGSDSVPLQSIPSLLQDVLGLSGSVRTADFSKDKSFSSKTGHAVTSIWATATPQELWVSERTSTVARRVRIWARLQRLVGSQRRVRADEAREV